MESFESLIASQVPVLVDFYAEWCGPCRVMKPILEELKRIKGDKIRIAKVDVDKHEELAATHRIQSVPTLMVYKQGKMLWRQSGVIQLAELQKIVEQYE
ncbi:MAG: thioredoxin [Bacteroidaceae bacterium]|nr:thioredoxin [Bacteroidaceae bacterium]